MMCVDFFLLKFNSDKKQLSPLFISVFASDCISTPTKGGHPLVVEDGSCDALHAWIGMTINLLDHSMPVRVALRSE